jgi:hypothetical protein
MLCAGLIVSAAMLNAGCTTLADARAARGSGVSRIYDAPLDTVWKAISTVVKEVGLDLVGDNRQEGYLLAQRGITPFSYGENVAIFVEELGRAPRTKVEVVSKKAMQTNIFAPSWENEILDKLGERLAKAGIPLVPKAANTNRPEASPGTSVAVENVDAVPLLNERGKQGYREWLTKKPPRAFVIGEGGIWYSTWGTRPVNTADPRDPTERAMLRCMKRGLMKCKVYAVDNRVVWVAE